MGFAFVRFSWHIRQPVYFKKALTNNKLCALITDSISIVHIMISFLLGFFGMKQTLIGRYSKFDHFVVESGAD